MILKLTPFILQGLILSVDEFYCHRRRSLGVWERVGHPIDTFVFSLALTLLLFLQQESWWIYAGVGFLSCLLVSKDEWVHAELSSGFENWLHALLFMLHPVVLIWAGYLWWSEDTDVRSIVLVALGFSGAFFLYQCVYWKLRPK